MRWYVNLVLVNKLDELSDQILNDNTLECI